MTITLNAAEIAYLEFVIKGDLQIEGVDAWDKIAAESILAKLSELTSC